jgi:hypothetical protein
VAAAIAAVMAELPAIERSGRTAEGIAYRRMDDILAAIRPLLARHGLAIVPDVIERIAENRTARTGNTMQVVHLHVRWIITTGSDTLVASTWGEGADVGDSASKKAATAAFKVLLQQVFAVGDDDAPATAGAARRTTRADRAAEPTTSSTAARSAAAAQPSAAEQRAGAPATAPSIGDLVARMSAISDPGLRAAVKRAFAATWGLPQNLGPDQVAAAAAWLEERLGAA